MEPSLLIPFLPGIDPNDLPADPVAIAAWTADGARHLALAASDNSIWITAVPNTPDVLSPSDSASHSSGHLGPPGFARSGPPSPSAPFPAPTPRRPAAGHSSSSSQSLPQSSFYRPRATSTASSILSHASAFRRSGAFSPPVAPTSSVAGAIPQDTPVSHHITRASTSDRAELREALQNQKRAAAETDDRSALGLGLAGLGRRGLPGVHGKEEEGKGRTSPPRVLTPAEDSTPGRSGSGTGSPRSASTPTATTTNTAATPTDPSPPPSSASERFASRISGFWRTPVDDTAVREQELKDAAREAAVNHEMEREAAEGKKEAEDLRYINERCGISTSSLGGSARNRTSSTVSGVSGSTSVSGTSGNPGKRNADAAHRGSGISTGNPGKRNADRASDGNGYGSALPTVASSGVSTPIPRTPTSARHSVLDTHAEDDVKCKAAHPVRIVLPRPGCGQIVQLKVLGERGELVVLRDVGLLDIISLGGICVTSHHRLDGFTPPLPAGSKAPRLTVPWSWQSVHYTSLDERSLLVVNGVPWLSPWPSPNGEVTRVVMLVLDDKKVHEETPLHSHQNGAAHDEKKPHSETRLPDASVLDLPGIGDIGVSTHNSKRYILHATPTSVMSYQIKWPHDVSKTVTPSEDAKAGHSGFSNPISGPSNTSSTPGAGHSALSPLLTRPETRRTGSLAHVRAATSPTNGHGGLAKNGDHVKHHVMPKLPFLIPPSAAARAKAEQEAKTLNLPSVSEGQEVQRDGGGHWHSVRMHGNGQGVGLGDDHVDPFEFDGTHLSVKGSISVSDKPKDAVFTSDWQDVCITASSETSIHSLDTTKPSSPGGLLRWTEPKQTYPAHASCCVGKILYGAERGAVISVPLYNPVRQELRKLSQPRASDQLIPVSGDVLIVADKNGNVYKRSLVDYMRGPRELEAGANPDPTSELWKSDASDEYSDDEPTSDRLDAAVTCSALIESDLAIGGKFLVMGDEDGSLRIWDAKSLHLRGTWTLFDEPVRTATFLDMHEAGSLQGALLCTSTSGSVGVISLRDMEELFLLPASRAPVTRIFVGGHNILVAYENSKARVWNVETREFRRSTALDAADDMLQQPGWAEVRIDDAPALDEPLTSVVGPQPIWSASADGDVDNDSQTGRVSDLGRLLQLDLRQLSRALATNESPLPALRGLLSVCLTFGINEYIDEMCTVNLGIPRPHRPAAVGLEGPCGSATIAYTSPSDVWRVSPVATGLRQLAIVALLRPFLDNPDLENWAADVIAFYTASLPEDTIDADLELFAAYYLDSASDVHQAARILFSARLTRMANEAVVALVKAKQGELPTVVSKSEQMQDVSARALTMIGGIALHRLACMTPACLKYVADSIALYLFDPSGAHVGLAIELCSKGFSTWQTYVDPMELLRRLFYLATHKDTRPPSHGVSGNGGHSHGQGQPQAAAQAHGQGHGTAVAAQARLAVLHVASSNAPLFMSTLAMDILDARTVEGRTSIMKLCVFMARKRPALLENGLPRIVDAVVKSLDPNIGKMREDVWETATVILNELVKAFSTIDFHAGTQRLVLGTNEGAVIMYDLKTASRLYVLEPHKRAVSAVSFSPDGRRLVTVSIDQRDVTVWKIGSSISGFFNVGGPPRQGHGHGEPYIRMPFFMANGEPVENTGALSDIEISWPKPRQAKIQIGETQISFETT